MSKKPPYARFMSPISLGCLDDFREEEKAHWNTSSFNENRARALHSRSWSMLGR